MDEELGTYMGGRVICHPAPTPSVIKLLELAGLAAIGGTIYAFVGMVGSEYRWPVFLACAGVAVGVIVYRKHLRESTKV